MTTAADFIKDTLAMIGVVDPRQAVRDEDMQTGIRFLNRLCNRMEANTISLGWVPVDNPSDTLSMQAEAELGVMYSLAVMLAPQYGVQISPEIAAGAEAFMVDLRRDQAVATPIQPLLDAPEPDRYNRYFQRNNVWNG